MNSDEWSTREKLAISSYVLNSDGQHWGGNALRMLVPLGEPDRPSDFFSAKKCAQQYSILTEAAQTPKRKRGERSESTESSSSTSSHSSSSIGESIVKKLTLERIEEIKKLIRAEKSKYRKLKHQIDQINAGDLDDKLDAMIDNINKKHSPKQAEDGNDSTQVNHDTDNKPIEKTQISDIITMPNESISEKITPPMLEENKVSSEKDINKDSETTKMDFDIDTKNSNLQDDDDDAQLVVSTLNQTTTATENPPIIPSSNDQPVNSNPDQLLEANKLNTDISNTVSSNEITAVVNDDKHIKEEEENIKEIVDQQSLPVQESVTKREDNNLNQEDQSIAKGNKIQTDSDSDKKSENNETINTNSFKTLTNTGEYTEANGNSTSKKESGEVESLSKTMDSKPSISTKDDNPTAISQKERELEIDNEDVISHQSLSVTDEYADSEKLDDSSIGFPLSMPSTPAYVDSFPSSPALSNASDADLESSASSRAWKKSIMILWKQVASHRYASLFLQPVTNDIAPNYSKIVYRAMDLSLLKKNLETGVVRTTSDFQRDLMLMFENALMYNNIEHDVYKMTLQMQSDVMDQVAQFLATQLMLETVQQTTPKGLRRSTLRKSAVSEKVSEARSKRTAAIEGENRYIKK